MALPLVQDHRPSIVYDPPEAALGVATCPICGPVSANIKFRDPPYSLLGCSACGLTFVSPQRNGRALIADLYATNLWSSDSPSHFGYADYLEQHENYVRTFKKRSKPLRALRPGSLLDVGCASGYFMKVMRDDHGWEVTGIEPSDLAADFGRRRYGLQIATGVLADADVAPCSFDLVTMWDVIEHLPDPIGELELARRMLKPDGLILLETQDVSSVFARMLGRKWHHYKHAEHLWHFDPATITLLLEKAGFDVRSVTSRHAGKYVSFSFIAERAQRVHPLLSSACALVQKALGNRSAYVNLYDEMVIIASPRQ